MPTISYEHLPFWFSFKSLKCYIIEICPGGDGQKAHWKQQKKRRPRSPFLSDKQINSNDLAKLRHFGFCQNDLHTCFAEKFPNSKKNHLHNQTSVPALMSSIEGITYENSKKFSRNNIFKWIAHFETNSEIILHALSMTSCSLT